MKELLTQQKQTAQALGLTAVKETPLIRLTYSQRVLNPTAIAANIGDFAQSGPIRLVAFLCTVFVTAPNTGAAFWDVRLRDTAGTVLATFSTSTIAPATFARMSAPITVQPGSANTLLTINTITTGAPGALFVFPEVLIMRI